MQNKVVEHDSDIKGIEVQLGQIFMALNNHPQQTLPTDTSINPKEQDPNHLMVVSLRNSSDHDLDQEVSRTSRPAATLLPVPLQGDKSIDLTEVTMQHDKKEKSTEKEVPKKTEQVQQKVSEKVPQQEPTHVTRKKQPLSPLPQKLAKYHKDDQYKKFLQMLKQIKVNILLINLL